VDPAHPGGVGGVGTAQQATRISSTGHAAGSAPSRPRLTQAGPPSALRPRPIRLIMTSVSITVVGLSLFEWGWPGWRVWRRGGAGVLGHGAVVERGQVAVDGGFGRYGPAGSAHNAESA
jgi:hypothetical protein